MMNFGAWGSGAVWMILFWIFVVGLAVFFFRRTFTAPDQPEPVKVKRSPVGLVRERYARGEISRDEYQTILDDLDEQLSGNDGTTSKR